MRKLCDNCGHVHDMVFSSESGEYPNLFGTTCANCGAIMGQVSEIPLAKENRLKKMKLKEECLRRIFGSKEINNGD